MKKILFLVIIFTLLTGISEVVNHPGIADAENNQAAKAITGNSKKGKYFYKDMCRHCHMPDSPHKELTPMTKTMDQWKRYFKLKYFLHHNNIVDPQKDNKPLTELVTPEIIIHIKTFLIKHAADSDQPQTCG